MKITIKEKEVEIKLRMRALVIYEELTDKAFNPKKVTDILIYFYSLILANEPTLDITLDDFFTWIDENPDEFKKFNSFLMDNNKKNEQLNKTKKK